MNAQKNVRVKLNLAIIFFVLGIFMSCITVKAASTSIYDYVTQMSIEDATWKWGNDPISVEVAKGELVYVQCTLYFTRSQWGALYRPGEAVNVQIEWKLPEGVEALEKNAKMMSSIDGKEEEIGDITIENSVVSISLNDEHKTAIEKSNSVEFSVKVPLKFEEGEHNLGDKLIVKAAESDSSKVGWDIKSVLINTIDADDDTKLLGNAYFEINEYDYQVLEGIGTYTKKGVYNVIQNNIAENDTYLLKNAGFVTIKDTAALLEGGFYPGKLYVLEEITPPIGYLPSEDKIKFAFYNHTDQGVQGTIDMLAYANKELKEQYAGVAGIAVFGSEEAHGNLEIPNIYVKNKKLPGIQLIKTNGVTGKAIKDVAFTLQIPLEQTGYSESDYKNLDNAQWEYDSASKMMKWTMKTDSDGVIAYPAGTVLYSTNSYELTEAVPEGYEGYGAIRSVQFKMNPDGSVELTGGTASVDTANGMNTIKIENQPVGNIKILKIDEAGKPLKGAEFAIYGTSERNTDDIIEKMGKKYYKLQEATTVKDGTITFAGLPYGEYYLVEKKAPQGYKILKDSHKIEINEKILDDGVYTVKITNKKQGTPIIDTGGKGIFRYILLGIVLFAVGGFLFLLALAYEKKRRRAKRRAAARRRADGQSPQRKKPPQKKRR